MSRGQIEQIGAPQEVYRAPRTRFVADFLGSSNVFSGTVRDATADAIDIDTAGGPIRVTPGHMPRAPSAGAPATVTVVDTRTHIRVARPEGPATMLAARMVGEAFVGATATIHIETAEGQALRIQKGHDALSDLPLVIGRAFFVPSSPRDGRLVAEG